MFDDSTFGDDNHLSHEQSRTKVVSKRSVSEPSDKSEEVTLWQRIKRSVAGFFGYGDEEVEAMAQPEEPIVAQLKAAVPAQQQSTNESDERQMKEENTLRRRRQYDDDDEDDDDEIEGPSGNGALDNDEHESTSDNEVETPSLLPDVPDDKYCECGFKLKPLDLWFLSLD
jgi:hypothetical protein